MNLLALGAPRIARNTIDDVREGGACLTVVMEQSGIIRKIVMPLMPLQLCHLEVKMGKKEKRWEILFEDFTSREAFRKVLQP